MIKKIAIIFVILIMALMNVNYAESITLPQIVDTFNNCSTVKDLIHSGLILVATDMGDGINISIDAEGKNYNLEYKLNGNILSTTIINDEAAMVKEAANGFLIDCIGQLHGYSELQIASTLNSHEVMGYTVENEGLEIKEKSDGSVQIKIDITKKFPLLDLSNIYIEVKDLEDLKNFISGSGTAQKNKGDITFYKDLNNTILVIEDNGLTQNSYKSLLSILEVMFDSDKVVNYFKENYSDLSVGNKEFNGFKIEVNPSKSEWEEKLMPLDNGYEFVRITVNKDLVNNIINQNKTNDTTNTVTENKKEEANTITDFKVLPRTGEEINISLISLYIVVGISCIGLFVLIYNLKRNNNMKNS